MVTNRQIHISGMVQGVGFRPFVYQLAHRLSINGFVRNDPAGVRLEIEGRAADIDAFMMVIRSDLPPLARIDTFLSKAGECRGYTRFEILQSQSGEDKTAMISPDIALCKHCLDEMQDPSNRRYSYPFISCTNCGPRYSIIESLPYDRPNTSMRFFPLCAACRQEYTNPLDRRFHAQPISCFDCGPTLRLLDSAQQVLAEGKDAIVLSAAMIQKGSIVALKGLGGFHLLCDVKNTQTLAKLRQRKQRPAKPFAVMFQDIETLETCVKISSEERALITSKEKPIVIVSKHSSSTLSELIAPGIDRLGVFLPYTPLHHLLLKEIGTPLVATSANLSDEPIMRKGSEVLEKLGSVVDFVLDHDRDILNANDDSVMQYASTQKITLRMGRGYAPKSMKLPFKSHKKILSLGANQKNSICIVFDDTLVMSPHIGDLNSLQAFEYFERTLASLKRFYDFEPELIVYDKHPAYMTTQWAKRLMLSDPKREGLEVQHHYAHLLSAMAEFWLYEKVLGFAFDGTGYGEDGTLWGGEVMIADAQDYERIATFAPIRLLGADKAIKEPRRSALALLFEYYTLDELERLNVATLKQFTTEEIHMLHKAYTQGINAPLSSSVGRLFDTVASLADIVQISSYEGESGLMMEQYVDEHITESFPFIIDKGSINLEPMLKMILGMEDKREIVSRFFNMITDIIFQIAAEHPALPLLFCGGVFQNRVLVKKIVRRCVSQKRRYYLPTEIAINDGGISLGQAWFALHHSANKTGTTSSTV